MMCTLSLRVYYHCYRTDCCCYHPQTSWVKPTENRTLVAELPVLGPAVPFDIVNSFYDFSGTSTYCGFLDSRLLLGNLQEPSGFDFYIDEFSFRQQYRECFSQLAKATDQIGGVFPNKYKIYKDSRWRLQETLEAYRSTNTRGSVRQDGDHMSVTIR